MFRTCSRLKPALLALALSMSAAAAARAQEDSTEKAGDAVKVEAKVEARKTHRGTPSGGGQGQQGQQPGLPAPLTGEQKVKRAFRGAFLSPVPYAVAAFNAGVTQLGEDYPPHKETDDKLADWGSRTARVFATATTYRLFGNGFYPALFKQDPRYERSRSRNAGSRLGHAVSRIFVTRGDNGNLQPNYSRFAGAATASALANVWERSTPKHDRIGADATLRRFGNTFISGAIGNIIREFVRR